MRPGIYRHYKGKEYQVVGIAVDSGTEDAPEKAYRVVYIPQYGDRLLTTRPLGEFTEEVDEPEYDYKGPRFRLVRAF